MDTVKQTRKLKEKAVEETRKLVVFTSYVWVVISLFDVHKLLIFRAQHISTPIGFKLGLNLVNALVLGKIVLLGDAFHLGERLQAKAPIYRVLFRSAVFAALLICFEILEEVIIGVWHHKTIAQSIPQWGGGGLEGKILVGILAFVSLIPLSAFMEIHRALGDAEFRSLFFEKRPKTDATQPETRELRKPAA